MEIYFFKVEFLLIISHLLDNYGVLPLTIGLNTKEQISNGGEKDLKDNLNLWTLLRFDHFRGLAGYWRVNGNSKSAIIGKWINSPGKTLLNKVKKDLGGNYLPIIAEDLGVITPDVEKLRKYFKLPGMKILQFAFDGNEDNPYLPKNIEGDNWVVYTGTHDNSTSVSWWENLDYESQ